MNATERDKVRALERIRMPNADPEFVEVIRDVVLAADVERAAAAAGR